MGKHLPGEGLYEPENTSTVYQGASRITVRNKTQCRETGQKQWVPVKSCYAKATGVARFLFSGALAKVNPVEGHFYLFRGKKQHRHRKNLRGKQIQSSVSLKHSKREKEPWFIISSLATNVYTPK